MSDTKDKCTFTFEITGFTSESAVPHVRTYLRAVFPEQAPEVIDRALERRPLRFRALATPERAVRLQQGLLSRGALATVSQGPIPGASPEETAAGPEEAPAGEAGAETAAPPERETAPEAPPPEEAAAEPGAETAAPPDRETAPEAPPLEEAAAEPAAPLEAIAEAEPESAVTHAPGGPRPDATEAPPPANEVALEETPLFFWNAWAAAVFSPRGFFRTLRAPGGTLRALLFAAVLGLLASVLSFPARMFGAFERGVLDETGLTERYLTAVFTEPLATVIATCLVAWLLHLGLRFMAGPRPFEVTLKVVAYTTATGVFAAIPRAGAGIAALLALVLALVGLSSAQRVRPIQAIGAVLFPVLLVGGILLATIGGLALGGFLILETLRS